MVLVADAEPLHGPKHGALLECDNFADMIRAVTFSLCAREAYKKFEECAVSKSVVVAGDNIASVFMLP